MRVFDHPWCCAVVVTEFSVVVRLECRRGRRTCGVGAGLRMRAGMRKIGS
jgi:hypothetical protein